MHIVIILLIIYLMFKYIKFLINTYFWYKNSNKYIILYIIEY